jgi:hypothetical protein
MIDLNANRERRGFSALALVALWLGCLTPAPATALGIFAPNTAEYILVGTGP